MFEINVVSSVVVGGIVRKLIGSMPGNQNDNCVVHAGIFQYLTGPQQIIASDRIIRIGLGDDIPECALVMIESRSKVKDVFGCKLEIEHGVVVTGHSEADVIEVAFRLLRV